MKEWGKNIGDTEPGANILVVWPYQAVARVVFENGLFSMSR